MSVYFDKARRCWRYDFVLKGMRYHDTKFKTMAAARGTEAEKRRELKDQQENPHSTPTDMGFLDLVNRRLDYVQANNSDRHHTELKHMAKRWVKEWGKKSVKRPV